MNKQLNETPMLKQYRQIKKQHPKDIVFFRMGDFYEMFEDDAYEASRLLNIVLTQRQNIPMCGVPHHAKDNYIQKLLQQGRKVVICEQLESAGLTKQIVKRGVTEIISPGTIIDDKLLQKTDKIQHHFILCIATDAKNAIDKKKNNVGIAYLDIATGDFFTHQETTSHLIELILEQIDKIEAKELILPEWMQSNTKLTSCLNAKKAKLFKQYLPSWIFDLEQSYQNLLDTFRLNNLKSFGLDKKNQSTCIQAAGVLIHYLKENKYQQLTHLSCIKLIHHQDYMKMNHATIKNLELFKNNDDETAQHSLFNTLNQTKTSMGSRLLYRWILNPLRNLEWLENRQRKIHLFYSNPTLLKQIQENLASIADLERMTSKIALKKIQQKELIQLKRSLEKAFQIQAILKDSQEFNFWKHKNNELLAIFQHLEHIIWEENLCQDKNNAIIKPGYSDQLDEIRQLYQLHQQAMIDLQQQQQTKLGISNLRIKYNRLIGYFIEISKGRTHLVPEYYIKKQSLINLSRYTIPELIQLELKLNHSIESRENLEQQLFEELIDYLIPQLALLKQLGEDIAMVDVISNLAHQALQYNYVCPQLNKGTQINIQQGRHPVIERQFFDDKPFIANDITLGDVSQTTDISPIYLITGPNMSGKSTYLRQNAIIITMAQIGSFIPASKAQIGLVDQIFTRLGACDYLHRGESTFFVEMTETAYILNNATQHSFIIIDEVGRGTSTYDGISIAWSILQHLSNPKNQLGKVLFATHYHELTRLAKSIKTIRNYCFNVEENKESIIFLYQIKQGNADKSYGIHVANIAGIPNSVIKQASKILLMFESQERLTSITSKESLLANKDSPPTQALLFDKEKQVIKQIQQIDLNQLKNAVQKLEEIQNQLKT